MIPEKRASGGGTSTDCEQNKLLPGSCKAGVSSDWLVGGDCAQPMSDPVQEGFPSLSSQSKTPGRKWAPVLQVFVRDSQGDSHSGRYHTAKGGVLDQ